MLDYAATYRGLSLGAGTQIQIVSIGGLEDLPAVKIGDTARANKPGSFAGSDYPGDRYIDLELVVFNGTTAIRTLLESLKAATITVENQTALPFTFQLPGFTPRRAYVRPDKRSIVVNNQYQFGRARALVRLHAIDPRIYDDTATVLSTGLPSGSAGLTFNATADFSFGGAVTGGFVTATNLGNYRAPWTATMQGPLTNPSIQHVALGVALNMTGTLASGDTLTVDSDSQTILLNETASRYSWLNAGSQWFELPPGNSTVNFRAGSGAGGTNTLTFRSTWL